MGALEASGGGNRKSQVSGETERGKREREMTSIGELLAGNEELVQ